MKRVKKHLFCTFISIFLLLGLCAGCSQVAGQNRESQSDVWENVQDGLWNSGTEQSNPQVTVEKNGEYTSKEEVAAYLYQFGELPDNYITKKEARKLGWISEEGNLYKVAPGKSIGGDYFGNYEGILPEKEGREYHECDIDTDGHYRGAKRIVYSDDDLIYYTEDHYESFTLLYGEE